MKRIISLLSLATLLFSSCQTVTKTARTADVEAELQSVAVADLEVSDARITHTITPSRQVRRGGLDNVKQAVESEALTKNGNADVLLNPEYVISKKRTLFGSKITSITVSGRPAHFKNFRTLHDSVWTNPAFRGVDYSYRVPRAYGGFAGYKKRTSSQATRLRSSKWMGHLSSTPGYDTDSEDFTALALVDYGYCFGNRLYLGIGTGFLYAYSQDIFMPYYINGRFNFSKKPNTLFLDYKIGGMLYTKEDDKEGDMFGSLSLGYSFDKVDVALNFTSLGYDEEYGYGRYKETEYREILSVGLSIGYRF